MAASSEGAHGLQYFSGESEDAREYKRWKQWVMNKLLTLEDKVAPKARGAYIYTLLSGKALECVEHLDPASYQKEGGERVLLERLDKRFPQKDASDEMSESLTEIFNLRAHDGENLKTWISRASELFEKCERKTNVSFPEEARGWLILNRSGLSEEQKAVVLARSLGVLKREEIGRSMRSCYPEFVVKKKHLGASIVEGDFGNTAPEGAGRSSSSSGYAKKETGAAFVSEAAELEQEYEELQAGLDFVAMAGVCPCSLSPLSILREKRRLIGMLPDELPHPEVLLVSSPGFGVLDSGCGRSIIGRDTLTEFHQLWRAAGVPIPTEIHEVNHFRKQGTIRTAIVRGQAPFLISRNALQTLKAVIDFGKQQLTLFEEQVLVPLVTNEAGQFAVKVVGSSDQVNFEQEVMCSTFTDNSGSMPSPVSEDRPAGSSKVEQDSSIDRSLPGGWFNINSLNMTPQEVAHRVRMSRIFVRFCCELFRQQAEAGRQAQEIRTTACKAVIDLQSDQSLRRALAARPRVTSSFQAGDLVAYWREQKYQGGTKSEKGHVLLGGHWFGTAVVMGRVGRNYVIAHRKQIFRVAPEQLRAATSEEKAVLQSPQAELLGIKDLLEGGTFKSHQFVDLVPGHYPTVQADSTSSQTQSNIRPSEPAPPMPDVPAERPPVPAVSGEETAVPMEVVPPDNKTSPDKHQERLDDEEEFPRFSQGGSSSSARAPSAEPVYGPVRRRVSQKAGEAALYRPPAMREEDFTEMMREMVPHLLADALNMDTSEPTSNVSLKREHEEPTSEEPPATRMRTSTDQDDELVDESKIAEWKTLIEKKAVVVHYGKKAALIREKYAHRFMGSRFVIIRKPLEENQHIDINDPSTYRIKSRWCFQGHLDPD
ncbi:unnamed protein product [Durusdinium trenchii]|uniref:Uncharacterized protein n=1 Tax=Durusdinium trenchii TaxID=1381693 RepID=A0ABP0KAS0_9DINO